MVVSAALVIPIRARIKPPRHARNATQHISLQPQLDPFDSFEPAGRHRHQPPLATSLRIALRHSLLPLSHMFRRLAALLHSCGPGPSRNGQIGASVINHPVASPSSSNLRTILWLTLTRIVHRPRPGSNISLSLISMISCRCLCLCLCLYLYLCFCKCQCQCLYLPNQYQTAL